MAEKLEPCPFCGGSVTIGEVLLHGSNVHLYGFDCDGCDEEGFSAVFLEGDHERAIAAWNTRAVPKPVPASEVREAGWLIELNDGVAPPRWLSLKEETSAFEENFVADSCRALRFARREDAEAYVSNTGLDDRENIHITDHIWDDGRRAALSKGEAGGEASDEALAELMKLHAHYAELLNMHDGGERIIFKTFDEWVARLERLKTGAHDART